MSESLLPRHPLLACVDALSAALDNVAGVEPMYATTEDKAVTLRGIAAVETRLAALRLRVVASADDVAEASGAKDVGAWCAAELGIDGAAAAADLRLARGLETRWREVATALAEGRCTLPQAHVITRALDDLPDGLEQPLRTRLRSIWWGWPTGSGRGSCAGWAPRS